jgi:hypothetical protein
MTTAQRRLSILIGVVGAVGSCLALGAFLLKISTNRLELPATPTASAVYRSVGSAYSEGFVAGFSLCFFLTLLAVAAGTWFEGRRRVPSPGTESVRIFLAGKGPEG